MSELCEVVSSGGSDEFTLECVGVLGNLSLPDLDYCQLLTKYQLIDWIKNSLQPGKGVFRLCFHGCVLGKNVACRM